MIRRIPLHLELTDDQFDGLHQALAKVRSTSKTVTLDKAAMIALLIDYSKLIDKLEKTYAA
jgi:hypothetical protein